MTAKKRSLPSLREAKRRSNPSFPSATAMDCFAGARNDGKKRARFRHCEKRSDEAIHPFLPRRRWIASLARAMTAPKQVANLCFKKISLAPSGKSAALVRAVPRSSRGALRGRHERWVRDAVDAARD
jgi:hypothetical protein